MALQRGTGAARALVFASITILGLISPLSAWAAPKTGTVTIVHALPQFTADIYLSGDLLLDGFKPTELTEPLPLSPGTYNVEIRDVGAEATSKPALSYDLRVRSGDDLSVVAHVSGSGDPTLTIFTNDYRPAPAGKARLIIRAVAQAPAADIELDGEMVLRDVQRGAEGRVIVEPGAHSIRIDVGVRLAAASLVIEEGTGTIVYLIGSAQGGNLDLMQQSIVGLDSPPNEVPTGLGRPPAERPDTVRLGLVLVALFCAALLARRIVRSARA